ncbi:MAG: hypothetical protein HY000_17690 [Planctomycetes bacterium]|nr:hypothetical protein [Planctomycetota bacterium]
MTVGYKQIRDLLQVLEREKEGMPLREDSPSIAAGFGGTLNLVISSIYIILVVLLTALPCLCRRSRPARSCSPTPVPGNQRAPPGGDRCSASPN